ncbi:hypothetical protein SELMODRAFT_427015 [Selaginella moellendorffii]|uniref:Uncharacterized protein n=1 Tax=Selaginella moellendorffii TaxID=88036 RepID=D8SY87_SELML|nr:uncharacterized protein LOC9636286 [Selaginella moellendorffii]EFJ10658.1 hypothetical protein SELMODRAFT_427015 [Selaginella moellendorffii]|eukprot:XP_002988239.1 uncharacterized protein LOC9636286 [Selaginella moellendorffii]
MAGSLFTLFALALFFLIAAQQSQAQEEYLKRVCDGCTTTKNKLLCTLCDTAQKQAAAKPPTMVTEIPQEEAKKEALGIAQAAKPIHYTSAKVEKKDCAEKCPKGSITYYLDECTECRTEVTTLPVYPDGMDISKSYFCTKLCASNFFKGSKMCKFCWATSPSPSPLPSPAPAPTRMPKKKNPPKHH